MSLISCTFSGCNFKTSLPGNLKKHQNRHHPSEFKFCDFKTAYVARLKQHIQMHELGNKGIAWPKRPNTHKCQLCDYVAPSEARVVMHARIHFDELPYECSIPGCGHRTKWKGNLKQHEDRHDPMKSKRFECPMCPKRFCTDYQAARHVRTHTQEKARECPDCDYKAATLVQVKRHQKRHHFGNSEKGNDTGEQRSSSVSYGPIPLNSSPSKTLGNDRKVKRKPKTGIQQCIYQKTNICSVCGYTTSLSLKDHMKTHSDDKPFHCQIPNCNFKGRWPSSVNEHTDRMHTPRNFTCPLAGCDFNSKDLILSKKHRRLHNFPLKKTLQCPLCPKKYGTKEGLDAHVLCHTGEKAFKCQLCDYKGKTSQSVRLHFGRMHAE